MFYPKLSIVTPTYNQGQYIEETIQSVLEQNYPKLEYIIIDGGSTDRTVEIIKKYERHLSYWISEPDKGQAHAINKGLKRSTGDIFNWLNSDDYLTPNALTVIANAFTEQNPDAVAGQTIYFKGEVCEPPIQLSGLKAKKLMRWDKGVAFVQPGLWLKTDQIHACGGIDENFHYAFDWDMVIRYLHKFKKVSYVSQPLVYFRLHEESKTVSHSTLFAKEEESILDKLSKMEEFKGLYRVAKGRNVRRAWYKELEKISSQDEASVKKINRIITKSLLYPSQRLNRITFGTIRNIIFGK